MDKVIVYVDDAAYAQQVLAPLLARGLLSEDLRPTPEGATILAFYAASVQQRLGLVATSVAATQRT